MVEIPEFVGGIFGNILNVAVLGVIGIFSVAIIGLLLYYFLVYKRKFNIEVKIISQRANDPNILMDRAAILFDRKNKTKFFKLLQSKIELECPPFRILQSTNKGDYLELYRKSEDEFAFLTKPRIDKEWIIRSDGKKYPIARLNHKQIEADYYWLLKRQQEDRSWISPEGFLSKIVQMLPILVPSVIMVIIFLFFLNALPEVLGSLGDVIDKLNSLQGVAVKG